MIQSYDVRDRALDPESDYNGPANNRYMGSPATITCTHPIPSYSGSEVKMVPCGEPGVSGTEGGWCPTHGVSIETDAAIRFKGDAELVDLACIELAKYLAPMIEADLRIVAKWQRSAAWLETKRTGASR